MRRILLASTLSLLVTACGSPERTIVETADGKVTTTGDGSYTLKTTDGATAVVQGGEAAGLDPAALASSLPPFAPPFPKAQLISNMTLDDGKGGQGRVVVLETDAPLAEVIAFYDKAIADAGVQAQMKLDQPESAMRGIGMDGHSGTLIAIASNGETRSITLTTGSSAGDAGAVASAMMPRAPLQ